MPNRIIREGILTSPKMAKLGWADLPNPSSLMHPKDVLAIRESLPRVNAGDELQSYKWALAVRLRSLRKGLAGHLADQTIRRLFEEAGNECSVCKTDMRYWKSRRFPTLDHVVALANGGTNEESNLRVICNSCNSRKADA